MRHPSKASATLIAALACIPTPPTTSLHGQDRVASGATARLIPAPTVSFPSPADSNSPSVWAMVNGQAQLFVLTSVSGQATRHTGPHMSRLAPVGDVAFINHPGHGVWFEAIIVDVDGRWYGFYHNEWPVQVCDGDTRTIPRIGAARSRDSGATWEDLGVVLEAPPGSHDCESTNTYFVGGVGDFSVALDANQQYLYLFFSQYARRETAQGVSVARLAWADRDAPSGKASVWWRRQAWLPARLAPGDDTRYVYPAGTPVYAVTDGWHDGSNVDAFWGPSVHWNTHLQQHVMLLNRAQDSAWRQEGIYVVFMPTLEDPASWSAPQRLLGGGRWYPQVLGSEVGSGTDKVAGARARFFMGGRSEYLIEFSR